jgi:hypothetical protein
MVSLLRRALRPRRPASVYDPRWTGPGEHASSAGPISDPQLRSMMEQVSARLAHVCAHLEPEAFDTLVRRIADFKIRWAERAAPTR